jgi:hypothetical protein
MGSVGMIHVPSYMTISLDFQKILMLLSNNLRGCNIVTETRIHEDALAMNTFAVLRLIFKCFRGCYAITTYE